MSDYTRVLDRAGELFPEPRLSLEGVLRRRDRKLRNQRIGAGLVALAVFLVAIGALANLLGDRSGKPAAPSITPQNVGSMHQIAFNPTSGGFRFATGDGVLMMGTLDPHHPVSDVVTYPYPCGGSDPACAPLWQAGPVSGGFPIPSVADGVVYAEGLGDRTLRAFPVSCGTGDATCRPLWTADLGSSTSLEPPLVVGNRVFVATFEDVRAYTVGCASGGHSCDPIWSAPVSSTSVFGPVLAWDPQTETLFVSVGRWILPFDCSSATRCTRGRGHRVGLVWDLAVDGGTLFVGADWYAKAFDISCVTSVGSCAPLWVGETAHETFLTLADRVVYAYDRYESVYAFPEACASDGSTCSPIWTSPHNFEHPGGGYTRPAVSGGVVFAGGHGGNLFAFPADCSGLCHLTWTQHIGNGKKPWGTQGFDARVLGDHLYVAAPDGLRVYAPDTRASQATSSGGPGVAPAPYVPVAVLAVIGLAIWFVRRRSVRVLHRQYGRDR